MKYLLARDINNFNISGVTFSLGNQPAPSAPLIVVRGTDTVTPNEFLGIIDSATNKLFPTSGHNVLSPGGVILGPGFSPLIENDDLKLEFNPPVYAVGFDILFQSLDCCSFVAISVFDPSGTLLYSNSSIPTNNEPGGAPGGSIFVGFASPSANIASIVIDDYDGNNVYPDANIGFDSFRLFTLPILANDTDPDGDPLQAFLVSAPSHGTLDLKPNGTFIYTPATGFFGTDTFTYKANDGALDSNIATVTITVQAVNHPPVITSAPVTDAVAGAPYSYDVEATDPDAGDTLTYSLDIAPVGMTIQAGTGLIGWTPTAAQVGSQPVTVQVQDQGGLSATQNFTVTVASPNHPPTITSTPITTATAGQSYTYDADATDPDTGDTLSYSLTLAPTGMTIDTATGLIQWTLTDAQIGEQNVTVKVQDTGGLSATQSFTISVTAPISHAPVAVDDQFESKLGEPLTIPAPGVLGNDIDPDGDLLAAILVQSPASGTVNLNPDGSFVYTPTVSQPGSNLQVALKWSWTSSTVLPNSLNVMMAPGIIDLNGDGVPDVIFGSTASRAGAFVEIGVLRALDGANGAELFTVTDAALQINTASNVAVGDLDGDGRPEIIACAASNNQLIAFNHDGTLRWRSANLEPIGWSSPSLADLDGDGQTEIVVGRQVLNGDGTLRWTGTGGYGGHWFSQYGYPPSGYVISLVADIDLDGVPEVVAGNTAYRADGSIKWQVSITDGYAAVGNFDDDPFAEIVLVSQGSVWLLEHNGTVKWGPVAIPGAGVGGPPTVADFDGDGMPEIGVAGATRYTVIETDGSIKWAAETQDQSSNITGSSVFDFEGDGSAEVVYRDEPKLRVYRGTDGKVLFETPMSSCTWFEYPLVADVDSDGHAEIVTSANDSCGFGPQRGIYVFGDAQNRWVPTRKIWNQHTYHITNVNEDGTIPAVEINNWQVPD